MNGTPVEWAKVSRRQVVVATPDRAWVHQPRPADPWDVFTTPMTGPGHVLTTRALLDASIAAAGRPSAGDGGPKPPAGPLQWAHRLASLYHTTHATPPLMAAAAARFEQAGRTGLAAWARDKVREERGHDLLALRDLVALGYRGTALVAAVCPRRAAAVVRHFHQLVHHPDGPLGAVGYAYALERLATTRSAAYVRAVQAASGAARDVTRCLRVHSAAGSDIAHTEDIVALVAALPGADRTAVALACHSTSRLLFDPALAESTDDSALDALLCAFRAPPSPKQRSPDHG